MKLNEKTGLYENYGLWHVPLWQTEKFILAIKICLFLVVLLMVIVLIKTYLVYRKRKKLSLWDQALLALTQLKKEHKVEIAYGKEFYVTVSTVLKKYFHDRFGYDVIGKTDAEVVEYLAIYHKDELIVEEIKALLHGSEVIKFANAQAAQAQIEYDYLRAASIIQRTIPEKK